jgi:vitamin B12 transporter
MASVAGAAFLAAAPALAQDVQDEATSDEGDPIIVLGDKLEESTPEELEKYGSRLEIVEGEAIDKAGYEDAAGALSLVPGLFISPKSGAFDYVQASLTGSRTSEVLFLVDGVRINNRLYASTSPLDTLPASMIERVEVLKGGQGLYYGTQAVGGIVNIVTRGFTSESDGQLEVGYDTNEGYHLNGYARGGVGHHYFVGYVSHDQADGFQPFRDEAMQPTAFDRARGYRVTTLGGKYAFEPSEAFRLSASYQHTDARLDFAKAEDNIRNWNKRNEEIASLKIDWTPSDRFGLYVKGYWHDWDSTYLDLRPTLDDSGAMTGGVTTVNNGEIWGFEDRGVNVLGEFQATDQIALVAGYDYQKYSGRDDVFLIAPSNEEVHAPFAQVKFDSGALSLAAGVRHNMPSDGQSKTVWNVSGRLGQNEGVYVRGQVGTSFRLPDAYELYVIDPCCERGNPDLVGEESFNVEGGVGYRQGPFSGEIMGFHRKVENLIDITYDLPEYPDGFIINTPGSVTMWGGEAVASVRLSRIFSATVDYTHTVATAEGSDLQLNTIPRDQAKLILNAQAPSGRFGGGATLNWIGGLYANPSGLGRTNYGDRAVLDLSAWAFLDRDLHQRIGLRLENALDADYDTSLTAPRQDITDTRYIAGYRGTPMTLHVTFSITG